MISSLRCKTGYPAELPALKGRTFTFSKGLTVLFGPNGCGKSTMLRVLGAYSGCLVPGWTSFSARYLDEKIAYPDKFGPRTPRDSFTADVTWDGTPTYLAVGPGSLSQEGFTDALDRGGTSTDDYLRRALAPGSSGQEQIVWLNRMRALVDKPPKITRDTEWYLSGYGAIRASRTNSVWSEAIHAFVDYIQSLPQKGPVTVLLDEPDKHMSIPLQAVLWDVGLPRLAETCQVIVASHSPFALAAKTHIELADNYLRDCRKSLAEFQAKLDA